MELNTEPTVNKKDMEQKGRYQYTYKIKNGKKIKFYGDDEVKNEFDIHHYGESGTLYYKR